MSNTSHFFGSTLLALGPANLYIDAPVETGDPGANTSLGGTQGMTITKQVNKVDLFYDQYGDSPANRVSTGQALQVKAGLVQTSLEILQAILQGFSWYDETGGISSGFAWTDTLYQSDRDITKVLKIAIIDPATGSESTDGDDIIFIPEIAPMVDTEVAYDAGTQRVFNTTLQAYKSTVWIEASTGKGVFYFSKSAVDEGRIIRST